MQSNKIAFIILANNALRLSSKNCRDEYFVQEDV